METDIETHGHSNYHFTNWATTYSCFPELYFEPETEDEIKQVLVLARKRGKKVKVVGQGHSPSDLACTTDFMISLKKFNKIIHVDREKLQATVQGGCTFTDMNDALPQDGLAFSVQGSISDLTAAGGIATAVHGSGSRYGIMSSYIVDMRLMLASGDIISISRKENAELFPAAAVNLGCLGIVLTVTFQCEKAYRLHQRAFPSTLTEVLDNLDTHISSSDHFRFTWFPYTDSVACFHASRTTEKMKGQGSWFWDMFIGYHVFQFLLYISTFIPSLVASLNRLFFRLMNRGKSERIDRSDRIFNFNCLFKQYVMEWCIPREKTGAVLLELKEWIEKTGFPAHFPAEVRFVKKDDIYLSPCYQRDSSYINLIMYRPYNVLVDFEPYWSEYQNIVSKYGGRPHWAKDHTVTCDQFESLYPKWQEFCQIREKLDPSGMFLNANLERVFISKQQSSNKNQFNNNSQNHVSCNGHANQNHSGHSKDISHANRSG